MLSGYNHTWHIKKNFDWKKQSVFVGNTQQFWLLHRKSRQCLLLLLYDVSIANVASLIAQLVKNPPAMRETWVQSPGWEDLLEKGKATHSSILAWRIPWGRKELDTTEQLSIHFTSLHFLGRMGGSILSGWESSLTSFEAILVT